MFKEPKEKSCIQCNKTFITLSPKQKCCSKSCTKQHWKAEVNSLGRLKYSSVGRKKGITPWNKSKKCPNISGKNNGFYNHHHSEETKLKIKERVLKTKQRNKTFNTSKPEQLVKEELNKKFNFVYHQYKSTSYPFVCDFYIKDLDLYIECNFHWTHGNYNHKVYGPFNPNNPEHQTLLSIWKSKDSNYFRKAIKVWTISDPEKLRIAKKNNLNYLVFYTLEEALDWIKVKSN